MDEVLAENEFGRFVATEGARERLRALGIEDAAQQDEILLRMADLAMRFDAERAAEATEEWIHLGSPDEAAIAAADLPRLLRDHR